MIIYDLDNTLFNTRLMLEDIIEILLRFGMSKERAEKEIEKKNKMEIITPGRYNIIKHLLLLDNYSEARKNELVKTVLQNLEERGPRYLFPDALMVIKTIKSVYGKSILVTQGDSKFQKAKVVAVGLDKIFDEYHYTEDNKIGLFKNFAKTEMSVSINDNIQEIIDSNHINNFKNIFVNISGKEKPADFIAPEISSLSELSQVLLTIL